MNRKYTNISAEEAKKLIEENKELVILDVRTEEEYAMGHIPSAKLMPVQSLTNKLDELEVYRDKPMLVHCASGSRSSRAVEFLSENNFSNLFHLKHGFSSWNYEIEK